MGFPLEGFAIVAKEPILDGSRPDFTKLSLVDAVRCFWFLNCLQPNIRCIFKDSNWVLFSHGKGVNDEGIGGRLLASLLTGLRVRIESVSTELLWSIASLVSLALI